MVETDGVHDKLRLADLRHGTLPVVDVAARLCEKPVDLDHAVGVACGSCHVEACLEVLVAAVDVAFVEESSTLYKLQISHLLVPFVTRHEFVEREERYGAVGVEDGRIGFFLLGKEPGGEDVGVEICGGVVLGVLVLHPESAYGTSEADSVAFGHLRSKSFVTSHMTVFAIVARNEAKGGEYGEKYVDEFV